MIAMWYIGIFITGALIGSALFATRGRNIWIWLAFAVFMGGLIV